MMEVAESYTPPTIDTQPDLQLTGTRFFKKINKIVIRISRPTGLACDKSMVVK